MSSIIAFIRGLWANEPVLVTSTIAGLIVAAALKFGVILPEGDVGEAVAVVISFLLTGTAARSRVTPA